MGRRFPPGHWKYGSISLFSNNTRFNQIKSYYISFDPKSISREAAIMALLCEGQNVRHNKKAEWGIGKIITVDRCGTIAVIFEGKSVVSIAKGVKYLYKVDANGNI